MAKQISHLFLATVGLVFLLNGCAAVGVTLFGVGARVTAGTSVAYPTDGIA